MKKIISLTTLAAMLLFASCSKDKHDNGGPAAQKKLKSTTLDADYSFTYNADGTLKELNEASGYKEKFTYGAGTITVESLSQDGNLSVKTDWTINNGKPVKAVQTFFNNMGQPVGTHQYIYEFNAKGLLNKAISQDNAYTGYEYDGNDDLIRITNYNNQGVATYKTELEYGSQPDLFPQYGPLRTNMMGFFFPPLSKHLPVSVKQTLLPGNVVNHHATYSYELDADGYVLKGTSTTVSPNPSGYSWTNTY